MYCGENQKRSTLVDLLSLTASKPANLHFYENCNKI